MPNKTKAQLDREIEGALNREAGELNPPGPDDEAALASLGRIRQGCRASTGQDDLYLHRNRLYRWRQTTSGTRGIGGVVEEQTGVGGIATGVSADELKRRASAGWQTRDNFIILRDGGVRGPGWMKTLVGRAS